LGALVALSSRSGFFVLAGLAEDPVSQHWFFDEFSFFSWELILAQPQNIFNSLNFHVSWNAGLKIKNKLIFFKMFCWNQLLFQLNKGK
jgi:hypothetical protein